jgi:GNAT superfamily N-acetyltransferase
LQRASLVETYEPFLGRAAVEDFIAGGNVERYFEERWEQSTVATVRGEIVGVAVREGALLHLVWVKPSIRSKGVGSALMEIVESQAAVAPSSSSVIYFFNGDGLLRSSDGGASWTATADGPSGLAFTRRATGAPVR